ncbi:MAG: hypothetical protein JXR10_14700 [Cyclobacteriaceae bacterium]
MKITLSLFFGLSRDIENRRTTITPQIFKPINFDEHRYAKLAWHYNQGHGFVYSNNDKYFSYADSLPAYRSTAFPPTLPVIIHIGYQRLYSEFSPLTQSHIDDLSSKYYVLFAFVINLISLVLFLISLPYFRFLALKFCYNVELSRWLTVFYILLPSALVYIGLFVCYENLVTPILVIVTSILLKAYSQVALKKIELAMVPIVTVIATGFRPHATLSFLLLFAIVSLAFAKYVLTFRTNNIPLIAVLTFTFLLMLCYNLAVIFKNNESIGLKVVSTQQAQAIFLGHQPYTRGSWNGDSETKGSDVYSFRVTHIPGLDTITSEATLYKEHLRVAADWIANNPSRFVWLEFRKLAMFMLPYNFMNLHFNALSAAINLGFVLFLMMILLDKSMINITSLMIGGVVLGAFLMTVISFFNHRFVSYAMPFMLLLAGVAYYQILVKISTRWPALFKFVKGNSR